jgi:Mannosyltransferase (PIG-V)
MAVEQAGYVRRRWRVAWRPTERLRRALVSVPRLPMRAFLASRLLVLLAGVVAMATVEKQISPANLASYRGQVGPIGYLLGWVTRSDADHYLRIAEHGYSVHHPAETAFFPLYPALIRLVGFVVRSDVVAGAAISAACLLIALILLHRLTELELGKPAANATVLLIAFAPLSFFFSAVYTESLFLMLSVGALLAVRQDHLKLGGVLAALAALTRPTGFLLAIPLAIVVLRRHRGVNGRLLWADRQLLWGALPVAVFGGYLVSLALAGFQWLAPFHAEAAWQRETVGPVIAIAAAVVRSVSGAMAIITGREPFYHPSRLGPLSVSGESILLLGVLVLVCMLLRRCFRRLPLEYSAYATLTVAICLSSPAVGQPLVSFDRYALTIFPLWMAAGAWVAKRRLERPAVAVGSILLIFYTAAFASWAFVA